MHAVTFTRLQKVNPDGSVVTQETLQVTKTTYSQPWTAYNRAQTTEKETFQKLLASLCSGIVQPPHTGRGRPPLPIADVVYGAVMKVYTTFSGRRAATDIRECQAKVHLDANPHYNSIFRYLAKPELTPLLKTLIEESAAPLKAVETQFAVDASGFGTSVFDRWYDAKWGKPTKARQWIKAHAMVGVRTNVVTSIEITKGERNDSPEMPGLVKSTAKRFDVKEVSADKAYLGHRNLNAVASVGAVPYIPFKSNSTDGGSQEWSKLWHLFWYRRGEFEQHYHLRSNVETTFSMIKRKFGGNVRSKVLQAQVNECLAKVLCHNLVVLVHEMHELGIAAEFWTEGAMADRWN